MVKSIWRASRIGEFGQKDFRVTANRLGGADPTRAPLTDKLAKGSWRASTRVWANWPIADQPSLSLHCGRGISTRAAPVLWSAHRVVIAARGHFSPRTPGQPRLGNEVLGELGLLARFTCFSTDCRVYYPVWSAAQSHPGNSLGVQLTRH